jgi:formyl-CoA transferase
MDLLKGVRVIDLSRVLAGPYCTMLLGDLGADVIKIEIPGRGDDTRYFGPPFNEHGESAYYIHTNRNKRGITLNLKTTRGLEILKGLIRKGDIVIDNFRVGTLEEWGLSYDELLKLRPGLIYATITGFGYTGPYRDKAGYDLVIQGMGGIMSITGPADGEPSKVGVAIVDITTGLFTVNAILAALFARERTGKGQRIDMALLDSELACLSNAASNYLISGETPTRVGNTNPNIVPYQAFKARDRYFILGVGNDMQWGKLSNELKHPEWINDERIATNARRVENRKIVVDMLAEIFLQRDADEWLATFEDIGVPAGPINTIDRIFSDPQVITREMRVEAPHPISGTVPMVGSPFKIPTAPPVEYNAPPTLGQHTDEVLQELLGYKQSEIDELRRQGVI